MRSFWFLVLITIAAPASGQSLVEHYVAAMQARGAEDYPTYLAEMQAAIGIEPGHAVLQFHLARACANTDQPAEAIGWLQRAYAQGAWLDPAADPWLEPLHHADGWDRILTLADSVGAHHGAGRTGFELEEFDLLPEGIEHDAVTDRFILGSAKRKILFVDREGNSEDCIEPARDGVLAVLGVRVDEERRRLWAVSVGDPAMTTLDSTEIGATRLHCWSLEDGSLLGRWDAPADTLAHGFNDVALHPNGSVVVTDPGCGALYGASLGEAALREVLPPESLRGPNGIVLTADGRFAYVAEYVYGVARVDLESGEFVAVQVPDEIALIGVDGLYLHEGELIVVQNYAGLDRAAAFRLDAAGVAVESVRVLEARHPRTNDPTTGVIVDGEFWYIVNSNIAGFDIRRDTPDAATWGTVLILRAAL